LKVFEKFFHVSSPGKFLKTDLVLESFGI